MIGLENPEALALLTIAVIPLILVVKKEERFKQLVGVTKFLTLSMLVIGVASPFVQTEKKVSSQPEIVVLDDRSRSADIIQKPDLEFEDVRTRKKIVASGNSSELKKGMLRSLEENTAYLLVSDGRSSEDLEGVADRFRQKNSSINILKPETRQESSVTVKGPSTTVPGAENSFTVRVYSTSKPPKPEVVMDGSKVKLEKTGEKKWEFTEKFEKEGTHQIKASIRADDRFSSNNRFFKTVKVREKPEILIVGDQARLGDELERFYDITYKNSIPSDLSSYYTVITKKPFNEEEVVDYVVEGNGLIYTGDLEQSNTLLPVKSVSSDDQSKGARIMMVIDISASTEQEKGVKKSKQIAYSLVEKLPFNNRVGAVAYNREAYMLSRPRSLSINRENLKKKISNLSTSGPSFHQRGIKGAKKMLNGTGNVIMITDGKISSVGDWGPRIRRESKEEASKLDPRLITVGVGKERNEEFLKDLADRGNGFYLDSQKSGRLNFVFEAGGAADRTGRLVVIDDTHFITDGLSLNTYTAGYSPAEPKAGADLLVTSTEGKPFLTTWRYGLGRVAAFTGGTKDLSQTLTADPRLVTRTVSWGVGQPQRKEDRWIKISDSRKGEKVEVRASYSVEGLKRQGENLYTGELELEEKGFHSFEESIYGYNYNSEIEEIGYSPKLEDLAAQTGGKVYTTGEIEKLKNEVKNFSQRKVETKQNISSFFIALALIIFLGEIGYRKQKGKK